MKFIYNEGEKETKKKRMLESISYGFVSSKIYDKRDDLILIM